MDSVMTQKRNVKRKLQRTVKRLQAARERAYADAYFHRGDPATYWEQIDEFHASIRKVQSALRRINRL